MKKLFCLAGMALSGAAAYSQTLQFSQVKLVTVQETVPVNTVWKVESVIYNIPEQQSGYSTSTSTSSCGSTTHRNYSIYIDGVSTKVGQGSQTASYSSVDYMHSYTMLPVWLPAGATLSGGPCNNKVSVIEFTIVP